MHALSIQEKLNDHASLEVSTTLNRLGMSQRELGKYGEAEGNLKRALAIREKALVPTHLWIATSLENLASVYYAEGQLDKVGPLVKRAREIRAHPTSD